jgi:hypothetical protein
VDIETKEKNDKIKSTVYEGRKKYLEFLERFLDNLGKSTKGEGANLEKLIENVNSAFLRFNENSSRSYERATILIGKEMGNIRDTMKKFSNELIEIFNGNKEVVSNLKRLNLIKSKLNENKEIAKKAENLEIEITNLNKNIIEKENYFKKISEEIERIKKTPEYLENLDKIKSIEEEEENIEKEISELRQLIDFKALSNFFHIFEDRMVIVKLYRDDFSEEFKKDRGNRLLNLLNESKLNNETTYDKIKKIQDKEEEIKNTKEEIKKDETEALYSELDRIKEEIKNLTNEKDRAENKKEKLVRDKQENLGSIKEELKLMNFNLD